jgi:Na+/H+-dicarboxylate symporter/ABC-type amino acid transport substrate-binding protein
MASSQRIVAGLGAGVLVGLFLGDRAAVFEVFADGFVRLLQMTVLPYVTVSIISGLGQLERRQARQLISHVGVTIAGLWLLALTFAFLMPVTFPNVQNASFFSTSLVERRAPFDFVPLYIPANPFHSLANSVVPAVVLFSMLIGVALMGVERKETLIDVLRVVAEAVSRATRLVSLLIPYGLFAIAAYFAGTLDVEQFEQLQVYLVAYTVLALFLSLWVLPGLVAALTGVRIRDLFRTAHTPLVTAFAAGDLFIVLPALVDACKTLLSRQGMPSSEADRIPDVIVPASFNFPHTAKILSVSFVLFAGWMADAVVPIGEYPRLALTAVVSFFGSLNAAVPFLLDLFRIPADTFQLFLATGVINSRVGTLLAAVHTLTVCLIGACAVSGRLRWQRREVTRYAAVTVVSTIAVIGGVRVLSATILAPEYRRDLELTEMPLLFPRATSAPDPGPTIATPTEGGLLPAIRARGVLRVGYLPDSLPFVFTNGQGELAGFDVELANRLASDLGVRLAFVPIPRSDMASAMADGRADVLMSGLVVTVDRATEMQFSSAYLDETLALVVRDHDRERVGSWASVNAQAPFTIAAPDVPYLLTKLRELAPRATIVPIASAEEAFGPSAPRFDAIALPAERGSAWTLLHPAFSVVVPEGALMKIPLAYAVGRRDPGFTAFLNLWIEMKRKDGTIDALFNHWILGQATSGHGERWSIIRDVLHWVD